MILFLDFDGVLHPDPCFDPQRMFEHAPRLAALLNEFPEAAVVLTTSWRSHKTFADLVAPLPWSLRARILGVTPHASAFAVPPRLRAYHRHAECLQWLTENQQKERAWIALDDRASWFAPDCDRLIECHSGCGLDEGAAGRLRFALLRARRQVAQHLDGVADR